MAVQPTDPSIVNFLTSRGFIPSGGERAPLFTQRKGIFESLGLGTDFRGEAGQNTAILNKLAQMEREKGVQLNPTNLPDFLRATPPAPSTGTTPAGTTPTGTTTPPQVPSYLTSLATQAIAQNQTSVLPSADETARLAIEKVTGSATFPLQQEATEAEKSQVKLAGQRQAEDFIRAIASRGFTPATGRFKQGVSDIEVDTLARTLNVDRRFAMLIATGLQSAAQDIVKQAQKEIEDSKKEGKEKRTEARDALKALGYVIDPSTGTLIRTEASMRGAEADIRAEKREERAETGELRAEAREERAERTEERQEIRLQEYLRRGAGESDFTRSERAALLYDDVRSRASSRLTSVATDKSKSKDGYTNPDEYKKFRDELKSKSPAYLDDFDEAFGDLLSPADAQSLGIDQGDVDPREAAKRRAGL